MSTWRSRRWTVDDRFENWDQEIFDVAVRKMELAIVGNNPNRARQVLNEFIFELGEKADITAGSSVYELGLPLRLTEALEAGGYETVQSIARATDSQLLGNKDVGAKSIPLIRERIKRTGIKFGSKQSVNGHSANGSKLTWQ